MPVLSESAIAGLLVPYLEVPQALLPQLSAYLDLLIRWNARTNLTAIRDPETIVQRHFGESLFAGAHLGPQLPETLLDLGSGAGFPGLPIAMLHPRISVTLTESQNKKATFLREAVRTLRLKNVDVWAGRVEDMPKERTFGTVTMRAVDNMTAAMAAAAPRAARQIMVLATREPEFPGGFSSSAVIPVPGSESGAVHFALRNPA